ncbi:MAG TPA: NnrU family protein [Sphingomicrobium sp.]|nr:NnrU family protein [Sphingomicrobium sp.]
MTSQAGLFLSAIAFVGTHFLLSHPLRRPLVRRIGERAFQGLYSLISLVLFGAMIYFYRVIGREPERLWDAGDAGWIAGTVLMWFAAILFVGSFVKNPALVGARGPTGGPKGVFRITRHPMMWSFAIWAGVHLMVIAAPKSLVFDGAIILLALAGAAGQDAKKARQFGEAWHEWTAQTAFVPFTRGIGNPGAFATIGGTLLFLAATYAHGAIGGMPAGFWRWM